MFSKDDLRKAAAETTHTAAERGAEALNDLKEYLAPLAADAKDKVTEVAERAKPVVSEARDRVAPLVSEVAERAKPVVSEARDKVENDVLPKLQEMWDDATDSPIVHEAAERGTAMVAALKGDLKVAKKELTKKAKKAAAKAEKKALATQRKIEKKIARKSNGRPVLKGLGLAALVGAIAIAIRQFLSPKDDGWTPQQPSAPYTPRNVMTEETVGGPVVEEAQIVDDVDPDITDDELSDLTVADVFDVPAEGETAADLTVGDVFGVTEEAATDEVEEATIDEVEEAQAETAEGSDPFRYGEGSYVGDTPPEAFTIKGNERSMKYHTAESAGYDRTMTDVWFSSEEAAEKAGFTRAQR